MKKMILGAFGLLLFAASCSDDDNNGNGDSGNGTEDNLVTPAITARITEQVAQDAPFTGILEVFPCVAGTSDFFGNYYNGKLSVFSGFYTIVQGDVFGENNRLIHLPIGNYNMVYWGTPKHEEPIDNAPEMSEPGITEGVDLSTLYFSLRPYGDGTYKPVFDLVHAVAETKVGTESLHASLYRVSAGLIVNLTQKNNAPFGDNIKDVKYYTKLLLTLAFAATFALTMPSILITPQIVGFYGLEAASYEAAVPICRLCLFMCFAIWPLAFTIPNMLKAVGDVRFILLASFSSMWLCRVGGAYLFVRFFGMGVEGIWYAMYLDWAFRGILYSVRVLHGRWVDKKVI